MPAGLIDLSVVTDWIKDQLKDFKEATDSTLQVTVTGLAPDAVRDRSECDLSVYLFHVSPDRAHRNTYPGNAPRSGPPKRFPAQSILFQPLALTLYYLVTAHAKTSYVDEQRAMGLALKWFHEHPIARFLVNGQELELTFTLEPQSLDEIGRLWQATSTPLRLSAVYRSSVVFLTARPPPEPKLVQYLPQPLVTVDYAEQIATPVMASTDGRATVQLKGAALASHGPSVELRALWRPLKHGEPEPPRTVSLDEVDGAPDRGQFRVADTATIELRVPFKSVAGRYLLHVRPAAGTPAVELWLDVP